MVIKKISFDDVNYIDVKAELDLDERILTLNLNDNKFKQVFNCYYEELSDNNSKLNTFCNCYLEDDKGIFYTCFGCIWGFNRKNNQSNIKVYTAPINIIFKNRIVKEELDDKKITGLRFKTSYPLHTQFKFHIAIFDIKYDSRKKITISKSKDDNKYYIDLCINSSVEVTFKTLSKILYSILEMFFLILGDIPKLESIILYDDIGSFNLYRELVDKYHQRNGINPNNEIISNIIPATINSTTIKEFVNFRNKTSILFDMLMIDMNNNGYLEINNSSLLQLLDGLSKTIGPYKDEEFREILEYYFKSNKSTKYILSNRDKRMINLGKGPKKDYVFIIKSIGHRNYLSHLDVNRNRKVFIGIENNYAYWKLSLCARLYIMDYLGIDIDKKEVKKLLKSIDAWAVNRHLRYKL